MSRLQPEPPGPVEPRQGVQISDNIIERHPQATQELENAPAPRNQLPQNFPLSYVRGRPPPDIQADFSDSVLPLRTILRPARLILPGDGIKELLRRMPGIGLGNIDEAVLMFDEHTREWLRRKFCWVTSVVIEDIMMRELDEYIARCFLYEFDRTHGMT